MIAASDGSWRQGCLGAEVGGGGEVSLIVIITQNQRAEDVIGGSLLFEEDIAFGLSFRTAVGFYVTGEQFDSSCPTYLELTIGSGLGFGIGGGVRRTGPVF
jgi:hypothetical protein